MKKKKKKKGELRKRDLNLAIDARAIALLTAVQPSITAWTLPNTRSCNSII